jgi:hypothetical protein
MRAEHGHLQAFVHQQLGLPGIKMQEQECTQRNNRVVQNRIYALYTLQTVHYRVLRTFLTPLWCVGSI